MKHIAVITLIILCLCVLPASAVILEVTVKGTVSALDRENNTLTIADPARYGCNYPPAGAPVCSYTPMANATLTGTVPAESAFGVFSRGDTIVATSLGGTGETWITLAKTSGTTVPDEYVTDIVGDPSTIPMPLAGNYGLDLVTEPDCTTCTGTTCTAKLSFVRVMSGTTLLLGQDLAPGHAMTYNGRNDGSSVAVTFIKGQASSSSCAGRTRHDDDRPAGDLGVYRPRGPADRIKYAGSQYHDPAGSDDAGHCPAHPHKIRHAPGRGDRGARPRGNPWGFPKGITNIPIPPGHPAQILFSFPPVFWQTGRTGPAATGDRGGMFTGTKGIGEPEPGANTGGHSTF